MKQRFSSLDVRVIAHELSTSLVTLRLSNIYDLSTRIFLFKFAKPDHRAQLLVEQGFRCHLTSFARSTAAAPSGFVSRLRKYLRTRRVTKVTQVGTDRVLEIQFSDGLYRLFLEFYAAGNIVLTDSECNVLAALRNVTEGAEHEHIRVGSKYSLEARQNYAGVPEITPERVRQGLQKSLDRQADVNAAPSRKKKSKSVAVRSALATSLPELPPALIDHALFQAHLEVATPLNQVVQSEALLSALSDALKQAQEIVKDVTKAEQVKGYIICKKSSKASQDDEANKRSGDLETTSGTADGVADSSRLLYEDFHPFRPAQQEADPSLSFLEFDGYNRTVDKFFSSVEGQRLESRLQEREDTARRKLEQARLDHKRRLDTLQNAQELNVRKAQAIEANLERVEEATSAINGLIAQGMDWVDVGKIIETEQKKRNPVAEMVKLPLKLEENTVMLLLAEWTDQDEGYFEGDETESEADSDDGNNEQSEKAKVGDSRIPIDIDLALSAWANASQYYDQKKVAAAKEDKTLQASATALKSTERKIADDLKKGLKQEKEVLRPTRKQYWFEKFTSFISSDGYLCVGGRDAQQNEILYRRYFRKGDIYVHADLQGAASVIILNNASSPDAPIPPSTLSQAGTLSVCTSSAWDSKAVMSAWWVNYDQVSKTAATGEYLPAGNFNIQGQKNYLPPAQLLLGFAFLFEISEESKPRHVKHRLPFDNDPGVKSASSNRDKTLSATDPNATADQEEESEEEFPDAQLQTGSDDEEGNGDFPDAELQYGSASESEAEDDQVHRDNPLTSTGGREKELMDNFQDEQASDIAPKGSDTVGPEDQATQKGVRHLSAKERRLQKKANDGLSKNNEFAAPGEASAEEHTSPSEEGAEEFEVSAEPSQPTTGTTKATSLPRGKRGKAKKIKEKYADQDDEERELALRLLGSSRQTEKKTEDAVVAADKQQAAEAAKKRRREQHLRAQKEGLEHEERRRRAAEDGNLPDDEDGEARDLSMLDALVGTPLPGDEILNALVVCAPWSALSRCKYKAKLQPGSVKKGKAIKEILSTLTAASKVKSRVDERSQDTEKMWPREIELVTAFKDVEVVNTLPVSKVRVMMPGASGDGKGGGGGNKGKARGGKGSKKSR